MNEDSLLSGQQVPSELLASGNGPAPANGAAVPIVDAPTSTVAPAHPDDASRMVEDVLQSDIGVSALLNRLKQSIASAKDFAVFLGKRSALEEAHALGLRKLCKTTHETIRRPDNRQGSYAQQLEEVIRIHERMVENGHGFSLSLHQMHEDLLELATNMERGRKHWKQTGINAEKRVQETELLMEKAKSKYDSLAEDYDRARTGDRQSGKIFGLKGPKSAAQHEEDLHRKLQAADVDYSSKVKSANIQRQELLSTLRPQAIKALQDLISECDSGLTLQLQKFGTSDILGLHVTCLTGSQLASFNEKLLLNNGLTISPINTSTGPNPESRSLRDAVYLVDNELDLKNYIMSFSSKVQPKAAEIKYERHPSLIPHQQTPPPAHRQSQPSLSQPPPTFPMQVPPQQTPPGIQSYVPQTPPVAQPPMGGEFGPPGQPVSAMQRQYSPVNMPGPPQLSTPTQFAPMSLEQPQTSPSPPTHIVASSSFSADLPPLRPVFGESLQTLFERDGSAVPMIVYQCIQAVDLYGLEVEGIYRLSGTNSHVQKIRAMFDNDSSKVDFRNPEDFFHDVNSVTSVLKQFFRDLPDPLLTTAHYSEFTAAARVDDDIVRRDSLHALINDLPDANYATLRALALHLYRVQERSSVNRMNSGNLAICLGPNIADAGFQVRVIETILQNTFQIFDDD
ncbi:hypothetical protein FGG08_001956 [Glutinoglossum americanum]|uniref:RhoGAP-domain-containing protein n=1 Tax=Glutinoglossum americanum TaxID=1670608 RepID=A0A9P8IAB4_9PEZI|nr:hypothetical protein FGG08_001956 [Glutinoglossum americanum]